MQRRYRVDAVDFTLLRALNAMRHRSDALDPAVRWLTQYGFYAFPIGLIVVAIVTRRRSSAASARDGTLAWSVALTLAEDVIKPLMARPRPTALPELIKQLKVLGRVPPPSSYSFPSGTAAACFAGAVYAWIRWGWRPGLPLVLLALLVSATRLYAGVHYTSDVLGGALLGAMVAWGIERLSRWIEPDMTRRSSE